MPSSRVDHLRLEPAALAVISTWEAVALTTGLLPTVTSLVMHLPRPARIVLVTATLYWMALHFECLDRAP